MTAIFSKISHTFVFICMSAKSGTNNPSGIFLFGVKTDVSLERTLCTHNDYTVNKRRVISVNLYRSGSRIRFFRIRNPPLYSIQQSRDQYFPFIISPPRFFSADVGNERGKELNKKCDSPRTRSSPAFDPGASVLHIGEGRFGMNGKLGSIQPRPKVSKAL